MPLAARKLLSLALLLCTVSPAAAAAASACQAPLGSAPAPPVLRAVYPDTGPTAGGELITVRGRGFLPGATVRVGGVTSPQTTFVSRGELTAVLPTARTVGTVGVAVSNPGGAKGVLHAGFTYQAWDFRLNDLLVGVDGAENLLKGMSVVTDDAMNQAFVTGIMTDAVGVLDLDTQALTRTFPLTDTGQSTKKLAFDDLHRQLWLVSNKPDSHLWLTEPDTGALVAHRDISAEIGSPSQSYPIKSVAVDPLRQRLYVLSGNFPGFRVLVFDQNLTKVGEVLDAQSAWALRWDTAGDRLLALTAPSPASGLPTEILSLPQGNPVLQSSLSILPPPGLTQPPAVFAFDASGDLYLASGTRVWKASGASGLPMWVKNMPLNATAMEKSGSELGVLHKYGASSSADVYVSRLTTLRAVDGGLVSVADAAFEASRMDAVPTAGGFIVGNGGDASLTRYPAGGGAVTTSQVGSAAEDVLLTPDGGRMLVLNRLGGSQLLEFDIVTGASRVVESCDWPVRMVMNPGANQLFVLSHFESKIVVHDLTTLAVQGEIPLGLAPCYSDSIMAMASDEDAGLMAALVCEQGVVTVVDGASQSVLATLSLAGPAVGAGPGRMNGAVDSTDPANRRVFVYLADDSTLYRLEEATAPASFQITGQVQISIPASVQKSYGFRSVYYSPDLDKVFAWNVQVDPDTLAVEGSAPGVHRFVGENGGTLFAQRKTDSGAGNLEWLLEVDAGSLAPLGRQLLAETQAMDAKVFLDHLGGRVAYTMPALSEVHLTELE